MDEGKRVDKRPVGGGGGGGKVDVYGLHGVAWMKVRGLISDLWVGREGRWVCCEDEVKRV